MDSIITYIEQFITKETPLLDAIEEQYETHETAAPHIGPHVAKVLELLIHMTQAKRVLEFGTCLGYSTVVLGKALASTGGTLIAVEYDEDMVIATRDNIEKAGIANVVTLIHGDASKIIDELPGPFDMILQDADKPLYPVMLESCIEKVRPFGIIAADDALFKPMGIPEKHSRPIHEYNKRVFADPRLTSTILPIGDGLTLSVRIK